MENALKFINKSKQSANKTKQKRLEVGNAGEKKEKSNELIHSEKSSTLEQTIESETFETSLNRHKELNKWSKFTHSIQNIM